MTDLPTTYANGSLATSVSNPGSNNITPIMHDTLGVIFLAIISLLQFFELRRMNDLNRKLLSRHCDCGCKCCEHKETGKT